MSKLSTFIQEQCGRLGWGVPELAERSGIPYPTLAHYANPKYRGRPDHENIIRLASVLEITEAEILYKIGYPVRYSTSGDERERRWAVIRTMLDADPRVARMLELFGESDDDERDTALTLLETYFNRPRPRRRRRHS